MEMKQITNEDFEECDKQLHKLRCLSQCSQNLNEINNCIKSDEFRKYVLSLLGVHAGVWSYVYMSKLFFLTENFTNSTEHEARRNIEWPFLLSLEAKPTCFVENNPINTCPKELVTEDEPFNNATYTLISIARKYEAQLGIVPEPLKNLGLLASLGEKEEIGCFSKFERAEKLLYVPSGELLTAILGWSIFTQQLNDNLTFPKDLSTKLHLTETLEVSKVYKLLVHVLEQVKHIENNKLHLEACATISFLSCKNAMSFNRDLSWGQVLCDLGLVKHIKDNEDSKTCSSTENDGYSLTITARLQTIAWWLIQQHESSCFARPGLAFNLTVYEVNILNSFMDNSGGEEFSWEILTMIFAILKRVEFDPLLNWESIYNFGLGPQQIWLRANARRGWRWVFPYDWCCMQVMPELSPINNEKSTISVPAGVVLLSLEAKAHYSLGLFEKNFRRIRTLVLIFALVENRLTYFEKIKNKANTVNYFLSATSLWFRQFSHESSRAFSGLDNFFENNNEDDFETRKNIANNQIDVLKELFGAYIYDDKEDLINIENSSLSDYIKKVLEDWPTLKENRRNLTSIVNFDLNIIIKKDLYLKMLLVNIFTNAYKNSEINSDVLISIDIDEQSKNWQYLLCHNKITKEGKLLSDMLIKYEVDKWYNYEYLKKDLKHGIQIVTAILKAQEITVKAEFKLSIKEETCYFILRVPIFIQNITN